MSTVHDIHLPFLSLSYNERISLLERIRESRMTSKRKPAKKKKEISIFDKLTPEQVEELIKAIEGE